MSRKKEVWITCPDGNRRFWLTEGEEVTANELTRMYRDEMDPWPDRCNPNQYEDEIGVDLVTLKIENRATVKPSPEEWKPGVPIELVDDESEVDNV